MAKKKSTATKKKASKKKVSKPKTKSSKKGSFFSKAPIRRLMKNEGASLVSDEAIILLIDQLESQAMKTTKKALSLVKDEKRKRVTADDITWAANFEQ